jgi:hypothetical protein
VCPCDGARALYITRTNQKRSMTGLKDDSPLDKDVVSTSEVNDTQAGGEEKDGGDEYASPVHMEQQRGITHV